MTTEAEREGERPEAAALLALQGHEPRNVSDLQKVAQGKETDSLLELPRRSNSADSLTGDQ